MNPPASSRPLPATGPRPSASVTGSIQRAVVVRASLGLAITLIIAATALYFAMAVALRSEFSAELEARARALATQARFDAAAGQVTVDLSDVAEVVDNDMGFQLWAPDGHLLAGDQELGGRSDCRVGDAPGSVAVTTTVLDGRPALRLTRRCRGPRHQTVPEETLVAMVIVATGTMDRHLAHLRWLLVLVVLGVMAVATAIQAWILRRSLRPLQILAEDIARRDRTEALVPFSASPRPVELRPVAERLDELMERLAEALARERRIGAAVAHELRTPLAGLRATLEVALIDPATPDRERRRAGTCLGIIEQMQRILEALLMLARIDAGRVEMRMAPVDLSQRLASARDAVDALARERRLAWRWEVPSGVLLTGDAALLDLVMGNLLGNAVAHADEGGDVVVALQRGGDGIRLEVGNSGSRVAAEDAERVCERFWRGDSARSDTAHHCGLGLALCRDVLHIMGGAIAITTEPGGRFIVRVRLPGA